MPFDHGGQPLEHGFMATLGALDAAQGFLVGVQAGQALLGGGDALVGDIVCAAGKGINRLHCRTQSARHEDGSDRKILVVVNGHRGAVLN